MVVDPIIINNILLILTAWGGAFLLSLWVSLIIWTFRDIRARKSDQLLRFLAVLIVTVLFIPGVVVYLIIRPPFTIEENYQKSLEEEALLRAIEEVHNCPGCNARTKSDWLVCPACNTKLNKTCHHCSHVMELSWDICPHCGTPAPGMRLENQSLDDALRPTLDSIEDE